MRHAESPIPRAILETVVYCDDLDAAQRFYEGVIGLTLVSHEPGRHLFFRVGNGMLLVFSPASTRTSVVRVGDQQIPQHGGEGASHFAFEVDEAQLPAIRTHLERQGVAVESEIAWPGSGKSIYCRDPAGNSVEFATRALWFPD